MKCVMLDWFLNWTLGRYVGRGWWEDEEQLGKTRRGRGRTEKSANINIMKTLFSSIMLPSLNLLFPCRPGLPDRKRWTYRNIALKLLYLMCAFLEGGGCKMTCVLWSVDMWTKKKGGLTLKLSNCHIRQYHCLSDNTDQVIHCAVTFGFQRDKQTVQSGAWNSYIQNGECVNVHLDLGCGWFAPTCWREWRAQAALFVCSHRKTIDWSCL